MLTTLPSSASTAVALGVDENDINDSLSSYGFQDTTANSSTESPLKYEEGENMVGRGVSIPQGILVTLAVLAAVVLSSFGGCCLVIACSTSKVPYCPNLKKSKSGRRQTLAFMPTSTEVVLGPQNDDDDDNDNDVNYTDDDDGRKGKGRTRTSRGGDDDDDGEGNDNDGNEGERERNNLHHLHQHHQRQASMKQPIHISSSLYDRRPLLKPGYQEATNIDAQSDTSCEQQQQQQQQRFSTFGKQKSNLKPRSFDETPGNSTTTTTATTTARTRSIGYAGSIRRHYNGTGLNLFLSPPPPPPPPLVIEDEISSANASIVDPQTLNRLSSRSYPAVGSLSPSADQGDSGMGEKKTSSGYRSMVMQHDSSISSPDARSDDDRQQIYSPIANNNQANKHEQGNRHQQFDSEAITFI